MMSSYQLAQFKRPSQMQDLRLKYYTKVWQIQINSSSVRSSSTQSATSGRRILKICKPNISKLKGRYSANTALIFNLWLKDVDICVWKTKLTNMGLVQLVKDFTTDNAYGGFEFNLDVNQE